MHLSPGEIQAYHDRQLEAGALQQAQAHLAECPKCQAAAQASLAQSRQVVDRLASLQPLTAKPTSTPAARLRLERRLGQEKESYPNEI